MSIIGVILVVLLVLILVGALPRWPYSASWGYGPAGLLMLILVVILVLYLVGAVSVRLP